VKKIPDAPPPEDAKWWTAKCEKQVTEATLPAEKVPDCRAELARLWRLQFLESVKAVRAELTNLSFGALSAASQTPSLAPEIYRTFENMKHEAELSLSREINALDLASFEPGSDPKKAATGAWKKAATALRESAESACNGAAEELVGEVLRRSAEQEAARKAAANLAKAQKEAEEDLFEELSGRKQTGFSRVVQCTWQEIEDDGTLVPALICKPGLALGGEEIATIELLGLPGGSDQTVTILSGEEVVPLETRARALCRWRKQGCFGFPYAQPLGELRCPPKGSPPAQRLSCDQLKRDTGSALVAVHLPRMFKPTFGGAVGNLRSAQRVLRQDDRETLSLVLTGAGPVVLVQVRAGGREASSFIPVAYPRWTFETGGFFAISNLVDLELVTTTGEDDEGEATVEVLRIADGGNQSQDTGIFLNFVPRNYQAVGLGLGFSVESGKAPSTFFGPTVRLRSFGERGLAALWGGFTLREVKRFPGVRAADVLTPNHPLLDGEEQLEEDWFIGVQLGFSFGPIQAGD